MTVSRHTLLPEDLSNGKTYTPRMHRGNKPGSCGSCWAFSAVGALEGLVKKEIDILLRLSAQQLVDCSLINDGCQGGSATDAFKYVIQHGISLDSDYTYTGKEGYCFQNPKRKIFPCSGYVKIPFGDEMALQDALAKIGPISVSIDTSPKGFEFYHSGIYFNKECQAIPNHDALLVGYGTADGEDYWIVKNRLEITTNDVLSAVCIERKKLGQNLQMERCEKHQESDMDLDLSSAFSKKKKKIPKKNETELPKAVDWRIKGYVTEVRDQGNCGSCWAFNAVGALEALIKKQTKILVPLSIQQLVDCSLEGEGCDGGSAEEAFKYVIKHGITLDSSYGYTGKEGYCYQNDAESTLFPCSDFVEIPFNDELALKEAVARIGPISVAIDISPKRFRFYHTGVYYSKDCSISPNHGALLVGYGTDNGEDYWIVKNSWGTEFGENGYIRIARNRNNHCGIASRALYPV
ncbi:CATS protein, partial [Polypterus senegalus]